MEVFAVGQNIGKNKDEQDVKPPIEMMPENDVLIRHASEKICQALTYRIHPFETLTSIMHFEQIKGIHPQQAQHQQKDK